jgi:ABC-type uncharacterized transport system permease subunit
MSLKAFHILFITLSFVLAAGFAGWEWMAFKNTNSVAHLVLGIGAALVAIALIIYGRYVLKKLKNVSYL